MPDTATSQHQLASAKPENAAEKSPKRILEPIERISEVLFGLIMVLAGPAMVGITVSLGG